MATTDEKGSKNQLLDMAAVATDNPVETDIMGYQMDKPSAAIQIAADIVRENPEIAKNEKLLKAILAGLRRAILEERNACREAADRFYSGETANRPEFTDVEVAVKFTMKCVAANITDIIDARDAP